MVIDTKLFDVRNISFSYEGEEIFSDISFSIEKGDVLCILGPNGTGKTTLIKCLNGLHDINSGEILINGKNIKKLSFREISRHIGYIPQSHVPSFPFKVLDVVVMGRAPYLSLTDSPKKEDIEIAVNALKTLGIEVVDMNHVGGLDAYVDGADEIDRHMHPWIVRFLFPSSVLWSRLYEEFL